MEVKPAAQLMPVSAEIVAWLRKELGTALADRIVLGGKTGKGTCRLSETGPDGKHRVFGSFKPTQWPADAVGIERGAA